MTDTTTHAEGSELDDDEFRLHNIEGERSESTYLPPRQTLVVGQAGAKDARVASPARLLPIRQGGVFRLNGPSLSLDARRTPEILAALDKGGLEFRLNEELVRRAGGN